MSSPLPEYVEYGPRETAPPPFSSGAGNFLGLILKGDTEVMQELCDRVLNKPFDGKIPGLPRSPFTYKPFSDVVLLFAGRWESLTSTKQLYKGSASEDQVSLWVPLKKYRNDQKQDDQEPEVCMMVPYMFVDNPMSLLNGREDYGYQKAYGKLQPSPLPGITSTAPDSVAVEAFGGVFGAGHTAGWVNVLRVDPVAASAPQEPIPPLGGSAFPAPVLGNILSNGVNQVFLKQFRDAKEAEKACYQHLVEAAVRFKQPHVKLKLGTWYVDIQLPSHSSHPITEDLGVDTLITPFAFELQSGLSLAPGKIIV
ncbi:MAG: hypothetical protein ACLQMH_14510 [Solirubrobacteraceae bacterium]